MAKFSGGPRFAGHNALPLSKVMAEDRNNTLDGEEELRYGSESLSLAVWQPQLPRVVWWSRARREKVEDGGME